MKIFNFFKRQLVTVIQWEPQSADVLFWKYPAATDEVKNASKLIVSPGQGCILVYEGKVTDILDQPGTYTIRTDNHPFITSLLKVAQLFESEHKIGLYFYRTAEVVSQGWGTSAAIKYIDQEYKIPIQLSTYGNFSYRLNDAGLFFNEYVGLQDRYTTASFRELMQSRIPQVLTSYLSTARLSFTQIDTQLQSIAAAIKEQLLQEFALFGVQLSDFRIEGNSFDQDTQQRIGRVADITIDSLAAAQGGLSFVELEKLRALRDAAKNEGGLAGAGIGLGAGMSMGKMFSDTIDQAMQPLEGKDPLEQLRKLKLLLDEQIITQEEFDSKKTAYLRNI